MAQEEINNDQMKEHNIRERKELNEKIKEYEQDMVEKRKQIFDLNKQVESKELVCVDSPHVDIHLTNELKKCIHLKDDMLKQSEETICELTRELEEAKSKMSTHLKMHSEMVKTYESEIDRVKKNERVKLIW